jgi:hypothetical protein
MISALRHGVQCKIRIFHDLKIWIIQAFVLSVLAIWALHSIFTIYIYSEFHSKPQQLHNLQFVREKCKDLNLKTLNMIIDSKMKLFASSDILIYQFGDPVHIEEHQWWIGSARNYSQLTTWIFVYYRYFR